MKILVLTSRYTATRDIVSEDFGRQIRLFSALKKRGHEIDFFCADYRKKERQEIMLHDINVLIRPFGIFSMGPFYGELTWRLRKEKYDLLIATSDPLWGVIGRWAAKSTKTPFLYDLHDNYETYLTYRFPFVPYFERKAIQDADIVTTVSYALKEKITSLRKQKVAVIQNGADIELFGPLPKDKCRKALNLPTDGKLIGYAGSIQRDQGIDVLIKAVIEIRKKTPKAILVIAGRFYGEEEKHLDLKQEGIVYLGSLSQEDTVKLINACDVAVVPNKKNAFTQYCFPYKVVEYMACDVPIVATKVGDVAQLLRKFPESLCEPDDWKSMASAIKKQFSSRKKHSYREQMMGNTWDEIARKLDAAIHTIGKR